MSKFFYQLCATLAVFFFINCFAEVPTPLDAKVPDSVISAKVKSNLVSDPSLNTYEINVTTHNGVVTLAGVVNSESDAAALIQLAQSTEGVTDVDANNLSVKNSQHPLKDMVITAKIKGKFIREKLMGKQNVPASVGVETNNGIVYLSGKVESQAQVDNAIDIVKSFRDVKEVVSHLQVVK